MKRFSLRQFKKDTLEQQENKEMEVIVEPNAEGGYILSIPGCASKGATIDKVINNLQETSRFYLEKVLGPVVDHARKTGLA